MKVTNNELISLSLNKDSVNKTQQLENSFEKVLENVALSEENREEELRKACREFEAYFLYQMFKEMNNTVSKSELIEESQAKKIYQDMLYSEISKSASQGRGTGLAEMMYRQISRTYNE